MVRKRKDFVKLLIKLYVVIYGLLLLILTQSVPLHLNMYVLILSQHPILYITSSIFEIASIAERYIINIVVILPLLSIEIVRTLICRKLGILILEIVIFLLITGNIVFTSMYSILTLVLVKFLRAFLFPQNRYREGYNKIDCDVKHCKTIVAEEIRRSQRYAMMLISMGVSILINIALITIFKTVLFLISVLIYVVIIAITYIHSSISYGSTAITTLIGQAVIAGIPPYGVLSNIKC